MEVVAGRPDVLLEPLSDSLPDLGVVQTAEEDREDGADQVTLVSRLVSS